MPWAAVDVWCVARLVAGGCACLLPWYTCYVLPRLHASAGGVGSGRPPPPHSTGPYAMRCDAMRWVYCCQHTGLAHLVRVSVNDQVLVACYVVASCCISHDPPHTPHTPHTRQSS